ncbi:unnamed protein product [Brassica oleracea var. botrytis]|uniref:(rape) hypothetical protein n=1 Tax=Brassica napus TaxID=3708 RepID=A0A816J6P1_BRANA|nr:unnamed protein product [Brassica napus]
MSPTEGSATKEMSLLTLNERDTTKRTTRPRKRDIGRIRVMGYSIDLPHDDVVNALRKHFSSCGEITDVCVHVLTDNLLDSFGFIYFLGGQGTVDRAMQLSGTDVGGWNVTVKPYPFLEDADWDPVAIVQGYDTCLGKTDIKRMLFDHFSSCGQIKDIKFQRSSIGLASVYLYGEGAEDKVLDLDGSYMGGCKILVKLIPSSGIYTVHPRSRHLGWPRYPDFSLSPTIPPRPTGTGEEGSRGQTETMLNPLWPKLELVMAGNSVEVPLPPDYEVRNMFQFDLSRVEIPKTLGILDLNHNGIIGSIPVQWTGTPLQIFNVSYNRLCGCIPTGGKLQEFDSYSYFHNKCLCGAPLDRCK